MGKKFLLIEQLRGIRYTRARIPVTAVNTKMRLLTLVDAAEQIVNVATYCGFRIAEGGWSNGLTNISLVDLCLYLALSLGTSCKALLVDQTLLVGDHRQS